MLGFPVEDQERPLTVEGGVVKVTDEDKAVMKDIEVVKAVETSIKQED